MATDIVFYPHAIRQTTIAGGTEGLILTLLDDVVPSHNFQDLTSYCAAQPGPQQTGSHMASPDCRFTTPQLATLLFSLNTGPYGICRSYADSNVDVWYRAGENLGMRVAKNASAHLRLRMQANALLALESIDFEEGANAVGRCRLVSVIGPNGQDPLVPTAGVALEGLATGGRLHTMGPIRVNGTLLKGASGGRLENNLVYDEESSHGEGFLSYVGIKTITPRLTVRSRKTDYMALFGNKGTPLSSLEFYLRSKLASGINEADAAAFHIKITATVGTIKARQVMGDKAHCELTIDLQQPGEDQPPYTIAVNQAIT